MVWANSLIAVAVGGIIAINANSPTAKVKSSLSTNGVYGYEKQRMNKQIEAMAHDGCDRVPSS
jgi:hypothetical protein